MASSYNVEAIPEDHLPTVARVLEGRLPKSARLVNVLVLHLAGKTAPDTKFYLLHPRRHGAEFQVEALALYFCVQVVNGDHFYTFSETEGSPPLSSNQELVMGSFINWSVLNQFGGSGPGLAGSLRQLCASRGLEVLAFECRLYVMSPEVVAALSPQEEDASGSAVRIRLLSQSDVDKVASFWKFSTSKTRSMMAGCVEPSGVCCSYGLFLEETLVSWVLMIQSGNFFALQTDLNFGGRGYGEKVLRAACREAGLRNLTPVTMVEKDNQKAVRLMERVGMRHVDDVQWIETVQHS